MARRSGLEVRVNVKALLIVAAVAVPLLVADLFFVLSRSRKAWSASVGDHLQTIAEVAASEVSRFVYSKIVEVGVLAAHPDIRRLAATENQKYRTLSEDAIRQRTIDIDRNWETPKASSVVSRMLSNPASLYLKEYLTLNHSFKRLLVTDAHGAAIAGSHKSIDYYQADEDWWTAVFQDGRTGAIHVGDVRYDPISRTNFMTVDAPIHDPASNHVIGVVRAIVDVAEMKSITAQVQLGDQGEAKLVKGDGIIISSRNASLIMKQKAEELETVNELARGRRSGYTTTSLRSGASVFIGFADTGLAPAFPELEWKVVVTQDLKTAETPIATIHSRALGAAFGGMLLVILVAVYFSIHRRQTFTTIEAVPRESKG